MADGTDVSKVEKELADCVAEYKTCSATLEDKKENVLKFCVEEGTYEDVFDDISKSPEKYLDARLPAKRIIADVVLKRRRVNGKIDILKDKLEKLKKKGGITLRELFVAMTDRFDKLEKRLSAVENNIAGVKADLYKTREERIKDALKQAKDTGLSLKQCRDAGLVKTAKQAKDAGFSAKQAKDAGFTSGIRAFDLIRSSSSFTVDSSSIRVNDSPCVFKCLPGCPSPTKLREDAHTNPFDVPAGFRVVSQTDPDFELIRTKVIPYGWGTNVVCVLEKEGGHQIAGYNSKNYGTPGKLFNTNVGRVLKKIADRRFQCGHPNYRLLIRSSDPPSYI